MHAQQSLLCDSLPNVELPASGVQEASSLLKRHKNSLVPLRPLSPQCHCFISLFPTLVATIGETDPKRRHTFPRARHLSPGAYHCTRLCKSSLVVFFKNVNMISQQLEKKLCLHMAVLKVFPSSKSNKPDFLEQSHNIFVPSNSLH